MSSSVYEAAAQAYQQGDYVKMVALARQVLAINADDDYAHYLAAVGAKELGQLEEATQAVQAAIRLNPQASNARLLLATVWRQLGKIAEAEREFKSLRKEFPDHEVVASNYSFLLNDLKRFEESIEILQPFVVREDIGEAVMINIGNAYRGLGDITTASRYFRQALAMNGKYGAGAKANLAVIALEEGRLQEAMADLVDLHKQGQAPVEAYLNLGIIASRLGKIEEAVNWIRLGEAMGLDSVSAISIYAFSQAKLGNVTDAI